MSTDYKAEAEAIDERAKKLFGANKDAMSAFRDMMTAATKDGVLDGKTKELMALSIAVAIHCEACVIYHARAAHKKGAGREEVAEAIGVAIEMGGGPAAVYGGKALEAFDEFAGS